MNGKRIGFIALTLFGLAQPAGLAAERAQSLAGRWRFAIDRSDVGCSEQWYGGELGGEVMLPGTLTGQGIGDPVTMETKWTGGIVDKTWFTSPDYARYREPGQLKVPFWLQPDLYYAGPAWFQREIQVPESWVDDRVVLFLERPHWETRVWVDGILAGTNNALATPHIYDLGQLRPGKHRLTIRVDNRMVVDVGENSHSVSDHTQGNWNGLVGRIELSAQPLSWIDDLQVYPEEDGRFRVAGIIKSRGASGISQLTFELRPRGKSEVMFRSQVPVSWKGGGGSFEWKPSERDLPTLKTWDEFEPNLYELRVRLESSGSTVAVPFGLRSIRTDGTEFVINGKKTFFRGTLECAIFPKSGHPPTDVASWKKVLRTARAHGLNLLRFHSWCPPDAAFVAADELGFYFHIECSSWANQSTTLGDGKPVDEWIYAEADRILKHYGNHPSFVMMAYGNEPGGGKYTAYLAKWVEHYRGLDARRLYTAAAGWPQIKENQFHLTPDPRVQAWGEGLKSRINAKPPETTTDYREYIGKRDVPVISHEIGQWCVYPNFEEMEKYTGYLKPRNFEIFQDRLENNGMGKLSRDFLLASGKLQALCYKEDVESALRTPGMGGFHLLDLHDFPGQGTALVGVLDPFWEAKGYIKAAQYAEFCGPTVLLARLERRVFTTEDWLQTGIELSHFGGADWPGAVVEWRLREQSGRVVVSGEFPPVAVAQGSAQAIGKVNVPLRAVRAPAQCALEVALKGTKVRNEWNVWVYPSGIGATNADVLVTSELNEEAQQVLASGGSVLWSIPGRRVRNYEKEPVKLGFSSIFWNTAWTGRQAPTTLGILCEPRHGALRDFPTDYHSDWQWWYLVHRAGALRLDLLPKETEPVVRVIDDWVTARPLGLVVEGRVVKGKVVVCAFDLTGALEDPVSRQMRHSLVRYLGSKTCRPRQEFTVEQLKSLSVEPGTGGIRGLRETVASSEHPQYPAHNATDGDPQTIWHTAWDNGAPAFPHDLVVELDAARKIAGVTVLPRQDGLRNGWIKGYEVYGSRDGRNWGEVLAKGELPAEANLQTIRFAAPVVVKWIKLRSMSGHANGAWTSAAEFNVVSDESN